MTLIVNGTEEELAIFSKHLLALQSSGRIRIISSSKPYPNQRSIQCRGYVRILVFDSDEPIRTDLYPKENNRLTGRRKSICSEKK